jgi:nitroreductase/FMN reductase [NAD(P)H]
MSDEKSRATLRDALAARFGENFDIDPALHGLDELSRIAAHRTHRRYLDKPVDAAILRLLCACALSAPAKSDLQQCDILIVADRAVRGRIADLIPDMPWIRAAPAFLVFLANGRRLPAISKLRGKPFPNDHLDQFFNAVADTAIVLAFFLRAAAAAGLGCCPISVIRDHSAAVSELLALPDRVIPLAGMCVGWPAEAGYITPRLSLASTLHVDRYDDADLAARIDAYDRRRAAVHRYANERDPARWGKADFYGWSEDKARQYGVPQRADFGAFVRAKGFRLD